MSTGSTNSIRDAENAIRRRFAADGFQGELQYESGKVIENSRWWYIPFRWIGCAGFIVNKSDLYVNWLESGVSLDKCFWSHDLGIFCDLVDFTFSSDTNIELATKMLLRFKHTHPNARGMLPAEPVWYRESEIASALSSQFPTFKRHFVWSGIPELFDAYQREGLQFNCCLSKDDEQVLRQIAIVLHSRLRFTDVANRAVNVVLCFGCALNMLK